MIITVQKFRAPDGKLFDSYLAADNHWKVQEGIIKANDAYYQGASLWHAIRHIPEATLWSEWKQPDEVLKLVHRDSLFWDLNSHLSVWRIDPDMTLTCYSEDVHNGSYSWDGGYSKHLGLYRLIAIVRDHVNNRGLASAHPAEAHWYNCR